MCRGSPESMKKALNLNSDVSKFEYMKSGFNGDVQGLDDIKDFAVMEKSMTDCGLEAKEKSNTFRISAAVLHIGNLAIEEAGDVRITSPYCSKYIADYLKYTFKVFAEFTKSAMFAMQACFTTKAYVSAHCMSRRGAR